MTPFDFPEIPQLVKTDIQSYIDMNTLFTTMESVFKKAADQQYMTAENREDGVFAATVWMYACMTDAAVNDRDYPAAEKNGCGEDWEKAVRWLKAELKKKKFLTGKPIHDTAMFRSQAATSLRCLNADSCGADLVGRVRETGSLTDFFEAIQILENRLKA